ncbi:aminoglycoside phosphotransferase family protein [Bailinhaonella thermotolerans]|uniref:Hydroxyurea phosphotransferase n=1 Tax=Bailinhaonella thermotolerans TaxID=1070861 RepID=A0A3A4AFM1_9ACTN|nr:aminoglycoside phosphotransferase family protein [Bailinhaonella thermotolerans]RJL24433.1 hydroxyurea phosphotransferase [Bailinhaonella thermotolerans]
MISVPEGLAARHAEYGPEDGGPAWIATVPGLVERFLGEWGLRIDGDAMHGYAGLVLPVTREDGTPAALKIQPVNEESAGSYDALRIWDGRGAVRLLADDPVAGAMLLERLDFTRPLSVLGDEAEEARIIAEMLVRLHAHPAPPGMRRLADVAADMLGEVPAALERLAGERDRHLLKMCAGAVRELLPESGDRLLHWDLHHKNVLAGEREPWLAIDPNPLAGDPGFDLMPALGDLWDETAETGDPARVLRRFDLMTEVMGLDRERAAGWTLGRALQNTLWDVADGEREMHPSQVMIAEAVLSR